MASRIFALFASFLAAFFAAFLAFLAALSLSSSLVAVIFSRAALSVLFCVEVPSKNSPSLKVLLNRRGSASGASLLVEAKRGVDKEDVSSSKEVIFIVVSLSFQLFFYLKNDP